MIRHTPAPSVFFSCCHIQLLRCLTVEMSQLHGPAECMHPSVAGMSQCVESQLMARTCAVKSRDVALHERSGAGWSLWLQIGCGNSFLASENRGPPQDDITVDMFVQEMATVKQALGLQEHHMLGHGALLSLASLTWLPGRCMICLLPS